MFGVQASVYLQWNNKKKKINQIIRRSIFVFIIWICIENNTLQQRRDKFIKRRRKKNKKKKLRREVDEQMENSN